MPTALETPNSRLFNRAAQETSKRTSAKAAAAAIVITMAANVTTNTPASFALASAKALDLAKRYGELAGNRLP